MQIEENIGEQLNSILDNLISKKPFVTIEEAAVLTGYKTSYLRELYNNKKITAYKPLGKVIYFRTSDILALDRGSNEELLELRKLKSTTLINNEFNNLDFTIKERIIMVVYNLYGKLNKIN